MGLALHNSDVDLLPLTEFRHLPPEPNRSRRPTRSLNYLYNGATIQQASYGPHVVFLNRDLPEYKLPLIELARRTDPRYRVDRRRHLHRTRQEWSGDHDEGHELARSDVPLPTDNSRYKLPRRPSLEREEAFRDPATTKRSLSPARPNDDVDVAELYRLGLLYDDEHLRGSGFGLDAIVRDEPAFTFRPAKRARKLNKARGCDPELDLALDLSFAELGRDDAIAQYLISPSPSETSDDETIQHRPEDRSMAPLRVIYELISSSHSLIPSNDRGTACPDLISDSDPISYDSDNDEWAVLPRGGEEDNAVSGDAAEAWIVLGDDS